MYRPQKTVTRILPLALALAITLALILTGCSEQTKTGDPDPNDPAGTALEGPAVGYFCDGDTVVPVRLDAQTDDALGTLEALFEGPTPAAKAAGYTSAIPATSKVLGVDIDGKTAEVDVSSEFGSAGDGGSASLMRLKFAQVVFTLTRNPAVKQVVFKINGEPMDALGSEGKSLTEPQTRADWEDSSPAVLVETPVLGDKVSTPVHASGTALVPTGMFSLSFKATDGFTVATDKIKVEGSGTVRGSFESTLAVDAGSGSLVPWYVTKDGKLAYPMRVPIVVE